jgi:hypothetical protein
MGQDQKMVCMKGSIMTNTNRRDFVKWLALTAAGMAALPQQIEAFEKYYEANTPELVKPGALVAVDEIMLSGMATASLPVAFKFYRMDYEALNFGVNLFGGLLRWVATPDQKLITYEEDFYWDMHPGLGFEEQMHMGCLIGEVGYIDSVTLVRKRVRMTKLRGSLVDA